MYCAIKTAVCDGIKGIEVNVEVNKVNGLPEINLVGHLSQTVLESKDRIRAAIINSGFSYPKGRITVNFSPAEIRKKGSHFDLPIAIGVLASEMYITQDRLNSCAFFGELSLDGKVNRSDGILPMLLALDLREVKTVFVPIDNLEEASLKGDVEIIPVGSLFECASILNGEIAPIKTARKNNNALPKTTDTLNLDFFDVKGQDAAKRAITIAVAGGHGLMMIGSPGCGKTMLSKRITSIMPAMTMNEVIESTVIYSAAGKLKDQNAITERPFRKAHPSISKPALLGGGTTPKPGELSLSHNGVLLLDELNEFRQDVLNSLKGPIEDRTVTLLRQGRAYTFPCNSMIVFASNPCKCGYLGDADNECTCSESELYHYRSKLKGPLFDRIDITIEMEKVKYDNLSNNNKDELSSNEMRNIVDRAIGFAKENGRRKRNAYLSDEEVRKLCTLRREEDAFMKQAYSNLNLTPRTYMKTLKVARTIADIAKCKDINKEHIAEALSYRYIADY